MIIIETASVTTWSNHVLSITWWSFLQALELFIDDESSTLRPMHSCQHRIQSVDKSNTVASMLVTDVGDQMCWWQVLDVGENLRVFVALLGVQCELKRFRQYFNENGFIITKRWTRDLLLIRTGVLDMWCYEWFMFGIGVL